MGTGGKKEAMDCFLWRINRNGPCSNVLEINLLMKGRTTAFKLKISCHELVNVVNKVT